MSEKVSVILPTYNEAENIKKIIPEIHNNLKTNYQIIVVDDNSPDKTWEIAEKFAKKYHVKVIKRENERGLGSAVIRGIKEALPDSKYIVTMDCDLSHDPSVIPSMLEKIKKADVVIGSRYVKGGKVVNWGFHRKLMSKSANFLARIFLGIKAKDVTSNYRMYKAEVLKKVDLDSIKSNGYSFLQELLYKVSRTGCIISEVPITFKDREIGKSKLSNKEIPKFFFTLIRLRFSK